MRSFNASVWFRRVFAARRRAAAKPTPKPAPRHRRTANTPPENTATHRRLMVHAHKSQGRR